MKTLSILSLSVAALVAVACGGGGGGENPPATPSTPGSSTPGTPSTPSAGGEPQTVDEQIAAGQKLYAANCASCHGDSGEGGGKTPRVVGVDKGALPLDPPAGSKMRKVQFHTAADVGSWAAQNMPPGKGGSLKDWEYWAIIAFDLKANGVTPSKKIDANSAKEVVLHK